MFIQHFFCVEHAMKYLQAQMHPKPKYTFTCSRRELNSDPPDLEVHALTLRQWRPTIYEDNRNLSTSDIVVFSRLYLTPPSRILNAISPRFYRTISYVAENRIVKSPFRDRTSAPHK